MSPALNSDTSSSAPDLTCTTCNTKHNAVSAVCVQLAYLLWWYCCSVSVPG
jgi:hypothetical protein